MVEKGLGRESDDVIVDFKTEGLKRFIVQIVILAVISVLAGLIHYIAVYKIICLFFTEEATIKTVIPLAVIGALAYLEQRIFFSFATSASHNAAYRILEEIRNGLTEKMMRMPLGNTMNKTAGEWKSIIVDKVETMELPLAHMIPEGISNIVLPVFVISYLFETNWKVALSSIVRIVDLSVDKANEILEIPRMDMRQ